ncbi:TWiK family of potassium channels protein 18-like [Watersipora subatra]|uniref:TWiK family of potassium channels protein 18-like n=1 Tax=Watersipora subatra TaxID=2589382 RepID=UPI00355B807F
MDIIVKLIVNLRPGDPRDGNDNSDEGSGGERRKFVRAIFLHILLFLSLIIYSFIGAAIFQALEHQNAAEVSIDLVTTKTELLEKVWQLGKEIEDKVNFTVTVDALLTEYDSKISDALWHGIDIEDKTQHNMTVVTREQWDFWDSFFYVATVYTTIGYGHLSPYTVSGKVATVIYALIGIPLCLLVLADLGGLLGELIKYSMRRIKRCFYLRWSRNEQFSGDIDRLSGCAVIAVFSVIWIAYLLAGAAIYTLWEEWSYFDSCYFLFISFSTIGFGDIVPQHPRFFLISGILIFLGLALVSTGLTIIQQIIQSTVNKATDEIDAKLGIEDTHSEGSKENVHLVEIKNSLRGQEPSV